MVIWTAIVGTFLLGLVAFELFFRYQGWAPSVVDSPILWSEKRKLASSLGKDAFIIIGASRAQLNLDLEKIESISGLKPVQLAIDGTTFIPVLENLAKDNSIVGTILVSVNAYNLGKEQDEDKSVNWVNYYNSVHKQGLEPYRIFHNAIANYLDTTLISRLEGAKPATVIASLAKSVGSNRGNYLVTSGDRSRSADYKKVIMPQFYAQRVVRHFGVPFDLGSITTIEQFNAFYKSKIRGLQTEPIQKFLVELDTVITLIKKIESRGGKVILFRFPTDKLLWDIDQSRYPKEIFWKMVKERHQNSFHFSENAGLSMFELPDGSHLDFRDKALFTTELITFLTEKGAIEQP